ncbi:hypothetical protein GE21DRAFT_1306140 [Neurospora crassa]|nr:hypothetical protein GE21DRAFT_1306140 [Neurospora crassa]
MKFLFPGWKLSWPAWVPDWLRLFPWVSFCSILVGIAGNTISAATLTFGFKNGGIIGLWVRALRGMSLSEVRYAVKRGKTLWVAWISISFGVAACGNAWFWSHSMYQRDVMIRNNGTLNMPITPVIISFHVYIMSFHVYTMSFHANIFCSEYHPLPSQSRFSNEFFPNPFFLPLEPRPFHVVHHDVRLEILTKMVRDLYSTKDGTIHRQRHRRFSDDVIDNSAGTGSSYRSHIAAGFAIKPETQKEGVLPCRMRLLSPMADIIETYQELALRISVSAAVDTGKTQPVQYWSEKAQRQWLDESNLAPFCFLIALVTSVSAISIGFHDEPIELFNAVAHRPNSPQNLLEVLAKAKDNISASGLKKFAQE